MRAGTGLPGIQLALFARLRATSGAQDCLDQFVEDATAHLQGIPHAEIVPLPEKEGWSILHRQLNTSEIERAIRGRVPPIKVSNFEQTTSPVPA
jgi:hypothetical protein